MVRSCNPEVGWMLVQTLGSSHSLLCVTLGKQLTLSGPHVPNLQMGLIIAPPSPSDCEDAAR